VDGQKREREEEHSYAMLTHWQKELKLLEGWLNSPKKEEDFHRDEVMKNSKGNLQESKGREYIKKKKEKQPMDNNNDLQQNNC